MTDIPGPIPQGPSLVVQHALAVLDEADNVDYPEYMTLRRALAREVLVDPALHIDRFDLLALAAPAAQIGDVFDAVAGVDGSTPQPGGLPPVLTEEHEALERDREALILEQVALEAAEAAFAAAQVALEGERDAIVAEAAEAAALLPVLDAQIADAKAEVEGLRTEVDTLDESAVALVVTRDRLLTEIAELEAARDKLPGGRGPDLGPGGEVEVVGV